MQYHRTQKNEFPDKARAIRLLVTGWVRVFTVKLALEIEK